MREASAFHFLSAEQWQGLLAPLEGESPCGSYLLYESLYREIREARREDDSSLTQGDWKIAYKRADWKQVERLCRQALSEQSKDLQLAAWLTEAWIQLHGMVGLHAGTALLLDYCETYWDDLLPPIDPEDPEQRLSPFIWMNDKLYRALGQVLISKPEILDVEAYTFQQREAAWKIEPGSTEERKAEEQAVPTRSKVKNSITLTPPAFYRALRKQIKASLDSLKTLEEGLDEQFGDQAPSFGKIVSQLQEFIYSIPKESITEAEGEHALAPSLLLSVEGQEGDDPVAASGGEGGGELVMGRERVIRSREEAYRCLSQAAEYLLRTEPHSPTPYLVKRAIAWGDLSLGELLLELVKDQHDLLAIYQLLGMHPPGE